MEQPDHFQTLMRGDGPALEALYRELFPMIRSLVRERGGSEADAKDLFQDALLVIFKKAKEPGFELTSRFSTFFYGTCRNLWLNRLTKKSATSEVMLPDDAKYIPDEAAALADHDLLKLERGNLFWRSFRQLGGDCQRLLELFFQSTPMKTIAEKMGYGSEGYAARRKLQCKQRLVELVKDSPIYPELI